MSKEFDWCPIPWKTKIDRFTSLNRQSRNCVSEKIIFVFSMMSWAWPRSIFVVVSGCWTNVVGYSFLFQFRKSTCSYSFIKVDPLEVRSLMDETAFERCIASQFQSEITSSSSVLSGITANSSNWANEWVTHFWRIHCPPWCFSLIDNWLRGWLRTVTKTLFSMQKRPSLLGTKV